MVSVTDSMQVTKETSRMREQCVPGAPSNFSSAWERGYAGASLSHDNMVLTDCKLAICDDVPKQSDWCDDM